MTTRGTAAVALAIAAGALAGCGDPYAQPRPSTPPAACQAVSSSAGAKAGARAFAARWTTWDWRSIAAQQRGLARLATGELAAQLRADAHTATASLVHDKPGSHGDVAAISIHVRGRTAAGLVVTREQMYTAGHPDLGGLHYRVYLVELESVGRRWEVSAWAPQP
jgi:hypothetical protein